MSDASPESAPAATPFWSDAASRRWLASAGLVAAGLVIGGYLLGDGLTRAHVADRSVTVRGLAERDVTADLAVWTIAYSASASDLATAQAQVERDTATIRRFFAGLGFPLAEVQPSGVNVSQYSDNGVPRITVRQRLTLRTHDIARARTAVRRQFELVQGGVVLEEGSGMTYVFTRLNTIKPEMVAAATRDARAAAEQFAKDSGTGVDGIKRATQGYFEITGRDGAGDADAPEKKVRVVTTVDFYLR